MKTRLLPVVLLVSLLLPVQYLRAASDVTVSTAATSGGSFSGGNANVFTPTANAAVANQITIQTSLNAGTSVTLNTASAATGSGDFQIAAPIAKTLGASSTLTLNAVRNLAINAAISASGSPLPLTLTAGGTISSSASIATNGGNITLNTAQTFTLGNFLNAGTGQILLQTGILESGVAQTVTASTVQVSAGATWRQRGTIAGSLNVAGTVSPGAQGLTSLQVNSALTLQSTATTILNLGGTSQGTNYGRITATGAVTLAGALQVGFANGFEDTIVTGNTFTILSGASITGIFTGLPNNSRIVFPNELGSVKITYTATAVTLSDWLPYIRELTWDPGTADTGTQVLTNTSTRAGRHYFHINAQATDIGAWKTRLTVATGEADLYLSLTAVPQTTASIPANRKSERTGSDGLVLRSDEFAAGQDWYLLVNVPTAGAQWSIFTGRAWVQDLGTLAWTDTNANSQYDIGEPALPSGSGAVTLGPEGIRFFRTVAPTGTPAWSLWLNGDPRDLAVRKNFVPFHTSATYYDRKQSGQMLVVPTYLGTGAATYFVSVTGNPGDAVNLDSRIQEVSDIGFNTTVSNVNVPAAPYRVYRVQVPVEQIAWDVSTVANTGNPNVCVRRDNVPAEFDNDAYSEAPGSATDSVTLVPTSLTDGTFFITVYGTGSYNFTLTNGSPTINPLAYTDTKINDQPNRAGWRFYALTDIPAQVGTLGWELLLSNQVAGTQIAVRRNKVPGRWQKRTNGSPTVTDTNSTYFDFFGNNGFLQRPGHQADVWYVGLYLPQAPLGAFTLDVHPIVPTLVSFDGSATAVAGQEPGRWKYFRVDVPSGVIGWDVRVRDIGSGTPRLVVRRDQLPDAVFTSPWQYPHTSAVWPSGHLWAGGNTNLGGGTYTSGTSVDWTQRSYDAGGNVDIQYRRRVMGMDRPLEPGTYYVGVYNAHATQSTSYTFESRGIGTGQTLPTPTLAFAGGTATVSSLAPREAAYFKVSIPANTPNWEVTLDPTQGEMMLGVRRGTIPDFELFDANTGGGNHFPWTESPQYDPGDREVPAQKAGAERYVLLPPDGQDYLTAGDYYLAVVGEGQNPADSNHTGTGTSSGVLTSRGVVPVANLGVATVGGASQAVTLESGQIKTYEFTVPAGTASLEVRLDNRAGNPWMSLLPGSRSPTPYYTVTRTGIYGFGNGQNTPVSGVNWLYDDDLITVANPPVGTYRVTVRANYVGSAFPSASATLVVVANTPIPVPFDGGTSAITGQASGAWRFFQFTVPSGVIGWDVRVRDIGSGTPRLVVRRDQLPDAVFTSPWQYPHTSAVWPSGHLWAGGNTNLGGGTYTSGTSVDWTQRSYDAGGNVDIQYRRRVMGMDRPLEPGTYYVGVYNAHATQSTSYTFESRGIGTGQTLPTPTLAFAGGTATVSSLAPREAAYFKVSIPANTPNWEVTLDPTQGEMMLGVRRGTIPDFELFDANTGGGNHFPWTESPQYDPGDREVPAQKAGAERYVLLPPDGQDYLTAGDYYLAVVGEGQNPADSNHTGTGTSSGVLTSRGVVPVANLGVATVGGASQAVTLESGQIKTYEFTVPAGTASLEVRLDNRAGNPWMSLLPGSRSPTPYYTVTRTGIYGFGNGQNTPVSGVNWLYDDDLITVANPPVGTYRVTVRANYVGSAFPSASATLVVVANTPIPVPFDGGTSAITGQASGAWRFFQFTVPSGVIGWDVRVRDIGSGTPRLVVRRDQLPDAVFTSPWQYPHTSAVWPSGHLWAGGNTNLGGGTYTSGTSVDWTQRSYDAGGNVDIQYRRRVMGMDRPLEPGTYYVGVYNAHATQSTSYTFESRGIGTGQTLPTPTLAFAGGTATVSSLAPREAAYFKVSIPANTPNWEVTLDPTQGEMMLGVRRGTIPDFELFDANTGGGNHFPWTESPQYDPGDREVPAQKAGAERYVLLPPDGQDYLTAGDYYLAVVGEGQNPADSNHTGTGTSSGVLTSRGVVPVANLGVATVGGASQAVTLESGQIKTYEFTVPAGTASLEVRLDNRAGNPWMSLLPGSRSPTPYYTVTRTGIYGFGNGQNTPVSGVNWLYDDDLITVANPPVGTYRVTVRANYVGSAFPSASATLVVRQKARIPLNFDVSQNGNGQSNSDTRQAIDSERNFYQVAVPPTLGGQSVVGWLLKVNNLQGDTTLRVYKTWGNADNAGITATGNTAVIVPPFLTLGDTWYVEVEAIGLTNYTITSQPIVLNRPVWTMPQGHNTTFGDSGNDSNGVPLPGDRGVDIGEDDWHFYAIDVPAGNSGLLRTELQAINGNPNLYLREDGVPTTDHDSNGGIAGGTTLAPRSLTATASEYGNWVPLDGRTEKQLRAGRWYLGVKATGGTNARYRLIVSNGQVTDVPLIGGVANNQTLVGRDWRYYRFTVPADGPNNWNLTFSQQVGDVVMWLRDTIPPGNNADGLETSDSGSLYYGGLHSWYFDNKNQGPYSNVGHDAAGTYTFNTPPLRPGSTYYAGFKANNDATFSLSSATSGGTIGVLPSLDFYTGTVTTSIPASSSVLYQIPVPPEATRFKYSSTHASSVTVRMEQGTLPGTTGTQHLVSTVANSSLNQGLATTVWPWQPNQTYYVRFVNTAATAQSITFTLNGKNALTEDEDNDRLPDQWELQYFGTTAYTPAQDNDKDGANHLAEWAFNLNPTRPDIAALTPGTGTAGLPVARLTGSAGNQRLTIEFVRRKNVTLTYTVQFANAPAGASFQPAVNAPTVTPIDANWERVIVEDSVTTGDQAGRFGRVRVTAP